MPLAQLRSACAPCLILLTALSLGHAPGATAQGSAEPAFGDVYVREADRLLTIGNGRMRLVFQRTTGAWQGFYVQGVPGNLIRPDGSPGLDVKVDGVWLAQERAVHLAGHTYSHSLLDSVVSVNLIYEVAHPEADARQRFGVILQLRPGSSSFTRKLFLEKALPCEPCRPRKAEGFLYTIPGLTVGDPAATVVDVPGPWFPKSFVRPATPYGRLAGDSITFHSAPDAGFGVIAMFNPELGVTVGTWMETRGDVNHHPMIRGDGERIDVLVEEHRYTRLTPGQSLEADPQRIEVVRGSVRDALGEYRTMAERTMPPDTARTPGWVREMVLLEVFPEYYRGGFREITERLPFYREVGFNTIYLMPHWLGGYSPIDLYRVDPALGTPGELRALVDEAHRLGMRVLFDMVIHGFNEASPVVTQRPDLFIRNEDGSPARHPTWGSVSTDWASEAYRQYMADYVLHDLRTYDIDGYRVDAASYKGPNWDVSIPYPAYRSGADAPEVMARMLEALQREKPDAVLLNEVFGPAFYSVSNLAHDNQTEAPQQFLEGLERGEVTAADYKAHLAHVRAMLPEGANRVYFARNHDTSWFYRFGGYTPAFLALDAIHALTAIPEVFAGDPENGPNPDDYPKVWAHYRTLFGLREAYPELAGGELLLEEVRSDNPMVFTALRRLHGRTVLVAISLSSDVEETALTFGEGVNPPRELILRDPFRQPAGNVAVTGGPEGSRVILQPFQVLVGRL